MTQLSCRWFFVSFLASIAFLAHGFVPPGGNNNFPPSSSLYMNSDFVPDDGGGGGSWMMTLQTLPQDEWMDPLMSWNTSGTLVLRGGSQPHNPLRSTMNSWKKAFTSAFVRIARFSPLKNKQQKETLAMMEKLKTVPIERVAISNTTILPADIIDFAVARSGMIGEPFSSERVQLLVATLQLWYNRHGYVMHKVSGIEVNPDSRTLELSVLEPTVSADPVSITTVKEMVLDEKSGEMVSLRKYKERQSQRGKFFKNEVVVADDEALNKTLVQATGRVKPRRIASALGMEPGEPFRLDVTRWNKVSESGLFAQIYQIAPRETEDGTLQLYIAASEAPSKNLEYGVGKSLYSGTWEGELDFQHSNLLGGGETLGIVFRRGPTDAVPSVRFKFAEGRLGLVGGYDVEAFHENIPDSQKHLTRRGATLSVQNPISPHTIRHTTAGVSVEQTTNGNSMETIASTRMDIGPILQPLPQGIRSNVDASVTMGTRVPREVSTLLPFVTASATTRQLFPLLDNESNGARPLVFALRHSVVASSDTIPIHVSKVIGASSRIRGETPGGEIASAFRGTTELRVPVPLPSRFSQQQDASVVLFGDWLLANKNSQSSFDKKACLGIGFRKSFQGIPLQYDVTYSNKGRIKCTVGLGSDFSF